MSIQTLPTDHKQVSLHICTCPGDYDQDSLFKQMLKCSRRLHRNHLFQYIRVK